MPDESPQNPYGTEFFNDEPPGTIPPGMAPVPIGYRGQNFDYRGQQTHGVAPMEPMSRVSDEGGMVPIDVIPREPTPEPVPVRIIDDSPDDYKVWQTWQDYARPIASRVVQRREGRSTVKLQNISQTVALYIGPTSSVTNYTGWRLAPGAVFTLECEAEIWAISADTTDVPLCAYMEASNKIQ